MQPMFVSVSLLGKRVLIGAVLVYPCIRRKGRVCKLTTNLFQKNLISQNSSLMKSLFTALVWSWDNKELHLFARVFH